MDIRSEVAILSSSEEISIAEACRKYGVGTGFFIVGKRSLITREKLDYKSLMKLRGKNLKRQKKKTEFYVKR